LRYVLVSPARNEARFIGRTMDSVVSQTVLPLKWVIVSDGSTDGTDDIVLKRAADYPWIELVRTPERKERHFAGKVNAFNAGHARLKGLDYDIIGNLDADVSFERDYIECLLGKFVENPQLGVAGTNYIEHSWETAPKHDYRFASSEDVSGACQLFRRECFEAIGGYTPSRHGGVDLVASLKARMHGWETRTFCDKVALHHRQQGTADTHKYLVEFFNGRKDYMFGGHPLWEIFRAAYRLTRKPYIIGGCLVLSGYFCAMLSRMEKTVSEDVVKFRRKEQMNRLRGFISRVTPVTASQSLKS
jgi:biofilm PGA synthesis N-glycosyltransferase PgaC